LCRTLPNNQPGSGCRVLGQGWDPIRPVQVQFLSVPYQANPHSLTYVCTCIPAYCPLLIHQVINFLKREPSAYFNVTYQLLRTRQVPPSSTSTMATSVISIPEAPRESRRIAIQRVHTKLVSNPKDLLRVLRWMYGEDGFYVEARPLVSRLPCMPPLHASLTCLPYMPPCSSFSTMVTLAACSCRI